LRGLFAITDHSPVKSHHDIDSCDPDILSAFCSIRDELPHVPFLITSYLYLIYLIQLMIAQWFSTISSGSIGRNGNQTLAVKRVQEKINLNAIYGH